MGEKGFPRLTKKTAQALAVQVVGTAKGLTKVKHLAIDTYERSFKKMKNEVYMSAYKSESGVCVSMNGTGDKLINLLTARNAGVAELMMKSGIEYDNVMEALQAMARIGVRAAADESKRCM